ncbi:MAG TPA: histidine triad nucleotide-binding protein [Candidatus Acidoferrum sp.]|jgi:histidine triad (HIT) family protein
MSADCLFCKIAEKKIPSKVVYEDGDVFAFEDIGPQAPTHILIIPRKHFASLNEAGAEDAAVIGKMHLVAAELARKLKLTDGYRTVENSGAGAGQTVFHLHLHLLGGREFGWPPG